MDYKDYQIIEELGEGGNAKVFRAEDSLGLQVALKQLENTFYLLNGGGFSRRLSNDNLQYYFDHMDEVISQIKDPLADYTNYQKQVSEAIKQIGGNGKIHGCIVDIDFYNHVFVNYVDRKLTGYWATDTVYKIVFPSIPQLLKQKQPALYKNYQRLVSEKTNNNLALFEEEHLAENTPTPYYDTDMYKMSRQICKLQRLHSSILTVWPKESDERNSVEKSNKKKRNNSEIRKQKESKKYELESNESEYNLGIETSAWDSSDNEMEQPVLIESDPLMKGLIDDDFPGTLEELIEKYRQEDVDGDSDTSLRDFS